MSGDFLADFRVPEIPDVPDKVEKWRGFSGLDSFSGLFACADPLQPFFRYPRFEMLELAMRFKRSKHVSGLGEGLRGDDGGNRLQ